MKKILSIFMIILTVSTLVIGAEDIYKTRALEKAAMTSDIWVNANRMNGVFRNNGTWFYDNVLGDWGLEWPKGSGLSPIFGAGQYIGAKIDGEIRVAGVQHSATEFQPGLILATDVADNKANPEYKWYEIRPNGVGDWTNWPTDQGAPLDKDGKPMLIGDQTIYSVWNDLAPHSEYGTNKLNAEVHQMAWAFSRADAMGDMIFIKWTLVNKSGKNWEDTYFVIWSDPDLGNAGDDQVGCDSTLGLGYCYNATDNDQVYGAAPPAVGIDFFQGPIVPEVGSVVALPDGTVLQDKKMLKMTSFIYYNNDDSNQGNPSSGMDVYNYMSGFWRDGTPITEGGVGTDPSKPPTKFMFSGDPETGIGWLDSNPADRRFFMTTGPFTMEPWVDSDGDGMAEFGEPGVQEIVAGVIVARGASNLNSVTTLKEVDNLAQLAYELNFVLAKAPAAPEVTVSELPNEVVLTWSGNSEYNDDGSLYDSPDPIVAQAFGDTVIIDNTEKVITDSTYNFYGYTVYQYSDASGADPVKVESWDIGKNADPMEYTKQRFIRLLVNKHPKVGNVNDPLINGKEYYFGVVAEGYLEFGAPQIFTSSPTIVKVTPQITAGVRYSASYNDTVEVTHTTLNNATPSDGSTIAWVVDPSRVTGADYSVTFNPDLTWNLIKAPNDTVVANNANQTGNDAYNVVDGLMVKVVGPDPGINLSIPGPFGDMPGYNGFGITGGQRWVSWPTNWGMETFAGAFGNGFTFFGSDLGPADYVDVEIRFAGIGPSGWPQPDSSAAALMAVSKAAYPDRWQKAVVYWRPNYEVQSTLGDVPFTVWDMESDPPRQLKVAFVEDPRPAYDGAANLIWDMGWGDDAKFGVNGGREYVFILNDTYDEQYTDYLSGTLDGTYNNVMYAGGWGARSETRPFLQDAFEFQIYASNINTVNDVFSFKAPDAANVEKAYLKEDLKKINVFPNPYYGYHSGEMNIFERWVRFTFLPEKCTIKIFDLSGHLVRELEKNDATTPFMDWDLKNHYGLPVASSVYIYHVEVPGVGEKVGKLAVFTPNERLDTY
ncbi:MAG TPA: hypothetical protein PKV46_00365 [Candidatus Marinimicrobia bacterium]|nr:hypothetical protein [Candidatus Neomarinimicrobiota bacterium]